MRRLRVLAAAMLVSVAGCGCAQVAPSAPVTIEQAFPAIDGHFRTFQADEHIPGLVWGVVRDGRVVHLGASGVQDVETRAPVNAETLFRIASMSKAFTALAILKLRDDGKLSLDALAETYVPEMKGWVYPTTDSPRIRVRDLLSHVGGMVTDDPWGDRQQPLSEAEFTAMLRAGVPFTRAPQTAFEYSNFGYATLGRIITNVSGRPYDQYISAEIMKPLGMNATTYEVRDVDPARLARGYRWENDAWALEPAMPHGVFGAMGGVVTSANDYAKWVAFLLDAWPARDGAETGPVRRSSVRELAQGLNFPMNVERAALDGGAPCRYANTYGMGMNAGRDCDLGFTLGHSGGYPGYGSNVMLLPDQGVGLFVFASRTYAPTSPINRKAALELHRAGVLTGRTLGVSAPLAAAYQAAGAMYRAGEIEPGRTMLAMNFLMDRSAENWSREFARLKETAGTCSIDAPINATGALTGEFVWMCERGAIEGEVLLAPTNPPAIQALSLSVAEK
ncbi:MAG: serine hydrolase domain-containing protein [Hyphomonadaceae bacterium]|nr:serine hydrolase domain-containing protein [Hyphomonadaceae bacterium]